MGIDYSGMMIVGRDYENLPDEVISEVEDRFGGNVYEWMEDNGLDFASLWYDAGTDGMIVGISVNDVKEKDLGDWFLKLKETFTKVREIIKVEPILYGTQHIY